MYPTNPVASLKPAVVQQLNIFGDVDEIPVNPPKPGKAKPPGPAPLHDAPAPATKAVKPTKSGLHDRPGPTPAAPAKALPAADELLVDPDEPVSVDLEAIETSDTPETILAKRMFLRMMWDIDGKSDDVEPDLFGQTSVAGDRASQDDLNRLDALIWLYGLNPDGGLVRFEWVCDVLGFDPHRVRRITGRSMRNELKRVVNLLSTIIGPSHARLCEETLSDYVDVTAWKLN